MKWDKTGWVDLQNPAYDRTKTKHSDGSDLEIIEGYLARELHYSREDKTKQDRIRAGICRPQGMLQGDRETVQEGPRPNRTEKVKPNPRRAQGLRLIQGGKDKATKNTSSTTTIRKAKISPKEKVITSDSPRIPYQSREHPPERPMRGQAGDKQGTCGESDNNLLTRDDF